MTEAQNRWYQENKEKQKQRSRDYYRKNRKEILARGKQDRKNNPEKYHLKDKKANDNRREYTKAYNDKYYEENKERILKQNEKYRIKNKDRVDAINQITSFRRHNIRKWEVIKHYSNGKMCCNCCGIDYYPFLTIDHIAGDGAEHRKKIHRPLSIYLYKNNFPPGYQILCWNCNCAKGRDEKCPCPFNK